MKKFSLILTAVLFLSLLPPFTVHAEPSFSLGKTSFTVSRGETVYFDVSLTNGGDTAENISFIPLAGDISVEMMSPGDGFSLGKGESRVIRLRIGVGSQVGNTIKSAELSFTYTGDGVTSEVSFPVSVSVVSSGPDSGSGGGGGDIPESVEYTPDIRLVEPVSFVAAEPGKTVSVSLVFQNITDHPASNITVMPVPSENLSFRFADSQNTYPRQNAMERRTVNMQITPAGDLKPGTYPVNLTYTYQNNAGRQFSGEAVFHVRIGGTPSEGSSGSAVIADITLSRGEITAGESFVLSAKVRNMSMSGGITGAVIAAEGLATDAISIINAPNSIFIDRMISGETRTVSFTLSTNADMKTGSYPVTLNLTYRDSAGEEQSVSSTFYAYVRGRETPADGRAAVIEVTGITAPSGLFRPGETIPVEIIIKNTGANAAGNVKITAAPDPALVPKSQNVQTVPFLGVGESKKITFSFAATAAANTQNYVIGFNFEYETGAETTEGAKKTESFSQYAGVNIDNPETAVPTPTPDEDSRSVPKIIVSRYEVMPQTVLAGQEFDLDLTFRNTHARKTVYNIKMIMSVNETTSEKGNVFTPVNGSNTLYIDRISPRSEVSHHLRMSAVPDAKAKNYVITVRFEYEDEKGNPIIGEEEVGVNVTQISKLELGSIYMDPNPYAGNTVYLDFSVQNTGKTTLYNLKVTVEADEGVDTGGSEALFGNFASGSNEYYYGTFVPMEPGTKNVDIVVTYDLDSGERVEKRESFTLNVMEMNFDYGDGMYFPDEFYPPEQSGGGVFSGVMLFVWIGAGVVVLAGVIVLVVLLKRAKSRKDDDFDD